MATSLGVMLVHRLNAFSGQFSSEGPEATLLESEVAQSCPTLCDPMDCSLPGSSIHGIFQARILEWVSISFSKGSSRPEDQTQVSCVVGRCFTIWATYPRPLQNEASCQSYWHIYHLISFLFSQIASVKQMSGHWRCLYMLQKKLQGILPISCCLVAKEG